MSLHLSRTWSLAAGLLSVLWAFGCGDGGGGVAKDVADMGKPKPPPGKPSKQPVDSGEPEDTPSAAAFREQCEKSCKVQAECLELSEEQCETDCENQALALRSSCYVEATEEQACLGELSCNELKAYANEGRRQHALCGEAARAYLKACTLDAGRVPDACSAMCARYLECDASEVSQAACEESCLLRTTSFHDDSKACGEAFLAFIGCTAKADCDEVRKLTQQSLSPVACNDAVDAVDAACEP